MCRCARCFLHLVSSLSYILRDKNTNTKRKEKVKVMNPICCGLIDQPIAAYNFHLSLAKANTTYLDTFFLMCTHVKSIYFYFDLPPKKLKHGLPLEQHFGGKIAQQFN